MASEESVSALLEALRRFKSHDAGSEGNLCLVLDNISERLARDEAFRWTLPSCSPFNWEYLFDIWSVLKTNVKDQMAPSDLAISLVRFTRNLVAGVPSSQNEVYRLEPEIRYMLHHLTSFTQLEDKNMYPLTRMLVQTLSNIVTLNDRLGTQLWDLYTTLSEDQNILARLLASPDIRTVNATLVLILNSINAEDQTLSRLTSPNGVRIIIRLLDRTEEWVSNELGTHMEEEAFTISYRLFESVLKKDLARPLFHALSIEDEPITPHQTTLLKLVDSHLRNPTPTSGLLDYCYLPETFLRLCSYSQLSIGHALGLKMLQSEPRGQADGALTDSMTNAEGAGLRELDLRLPKVSAAMVILLQCLATILLLVQDADDVESSRFSGYSAVFDATQASGFVETLIETLRLVDRFLPRIVFGKEVAPSDMSLSSESSERIKGFSYLKRDLVRLLGTLCYERPDIQNRVRECGGIPVLLSLCIIDERNPYMQEHALFALRNILHQNPANQAVVESLQLSERLQF